MPEMILPSDGVFQEGPSQPSPVDPALSGAWEQFHLLADSIPAQLVYIDRELRIRFVNRGFQERYGLTRAQVVGKQVRELAGEELFARLQPHIDAVLAGQQVTFALDIPASIASPGHLQVSYRPHFNEQGLVVGYFSQSIDISERVSAEEALRASERRYRTVFETTGTATVISEADTTLSLVNEEFVRLSGYSREEIEHRKSWTEFVVEEHRQRMLEYHRARRSREGGAPAVYEFDFVDRLGKVSNMMATVRLIPGTGQSVASYQDITVHKRGEQALAANLRFLKVLIDTIPNPVFFKDASGIYLGCNRAFLKAFQLDEEQVIGKTVYDLAPRELAEEYTTMDRRLMATTGTQVYESRVLFADGIRHDVIFSKATFGRDDGTPGGLVGVMVDITGLKQAGLEIRTLQRQQQALLDNIPDMAWLKDTESRFIAVNEAFARACGTSAAALVGKSELDIWPRTMAEGFIRDDRQVMESREQKRIEELLEEPGGEQYWVETIKRPVMDELGVVVGTTGIARNIKARKLAEQALRESEERFRSIFEQNEDAIVLLRRLTLDIIDANLAAEQLFGYSRTELEQLGLSAFIPHQVQEAFLSALSSAGTDGGFHIQQLGNLTRPGDAITVSIWGKVIHLRDEEVVFCSIRNITERIRLEEEARIAHSRLIHVNKMSSLGVLVSGIGHEINNPNTFIQGNASILEKIWHDASPILQQHCAETGGGKKVGGLPLQELERIVPRLLQGIKEGVRRISAIVGNLKDYAREERSAGPTAVDVNKVIRDGSMILSPLIHRRTDTFLLQLEDDLPPALGKAQQIEQVVINLIMNGLQALPSKKQGLTVSSRADREAGTIVITVRDEGEGMTPEVLGRIIEPFFSTRLDQGGSGLGLSICASIIKEHHGTLQFHSTPGTGTTAVVTLAMASQEPQHTSQGEISHA